MFDVINNKSKLLGDDLKEENDLESLFKVGSKVLFQQGIDGLDDFELISFVVIR